MILGRKSFCKRCERRTFRYRDRSCVSCRKVSSAKWYKRNPERLTKKSAAWFRKHPGKRKQCDDRWRKKNTSRVKQSGVKWRKENKGKMLNYYYLKKYGIDRATYDRMFSEQSGVCYVCHQPESRKIHKKISRLSVDHCHETGAVRKLLCARCNHVLGHIHEDAQLLRKLADYLDEHRK